MIIVMYDIVNPVLLFFFTYLFTFYLFYFLYFALDFYLISIFFFYISAIHKNNICKYKCIIDPLEDVHISFHRENDKFILFWQHEQHLTWKSCRSPTLTQLIMINIKFKVQSNLMSIAIAPYKGYCIKIVNNLHITCK
jgi:hypothetical protein